jgi:long-subunit acyl-CoA synthetase (AMP-forming)
MSVLRACLPALAESDVTLESYGRSGQRLRRSSGRDLIAEILRYRRVFASLPSSDGPTRVALLFKSEETIEFLVASLAAMAEGCIVVPLYPNWDGETQKRYLDLYRLRVVAAGPGFQSRAESWRDDIDAVLVIENGRTGETGERGESGQGGENVGSFEVDLDADRVRDVFPVLPADQPCAWIFTSGTSGKLAKCTEITVGNLDAAIENIRSLTFLRQGMVVHSPLSVSHVFAFVVVLAFLALRPRRLIFSDVQYLSRLGQDVIGSIDAVILVPIVIHRMRAAVYEKIIGGARAGASGNGAPTSTPAGDVVPSTAPKRSASWLARKARRCLARVVRIAEEAVLRREDGVPGWRWRWWAVFVVRGLLGREIRSRLGSPEFVVVGGAKPDLRAMAFLEAVGIRCLQGWGMTETTGPLAVCHLGDRYRGALGTCGDLFPSTRATIIDGELVVEGPQIARGYVDPDGSRIPFRGRKRTGDSAIIDGSGRLRVIGKASDRITTENGINYDPRPMEDELKELDLETGRNFEEIVVIGDGKPRLGAVFFPRTTISTVTPAAAAPAAAGSASAVATSSACSSSASSAPRNPSGSALEFDAHANRLLGAYNRSKPIDERIAVYAVSRDTIVEVGGLGPSGKLVRRRIEESFAGIYGQTLAV